MRKRERTGGAISQKIFIYRDLNEILYMSGNLLSSFTLTFVKIFKSDCSYISHFNTICYK